MSNNEFTYININKAFVKEVETKEGGSFYSVFLPKGSVTTLLEKENDTYELKDISGGNFTVNENMCRPSKLNDHEYTLMFPTQKLETNEPWTIDLHVNPNGELQPTEQTPYPSEVLRISPTVLKKIIADANLAYKKENTVKLHFPIQWVKTDLTSKNNYVFNSVTLPQDVFIDGENVSLAKFYPRSYQLEKVDKGYNVVLSQDYEIELQIPERDFDENGNAKVTFDENNKAVYSKKITVTAATLKNELDASRERYKNSQAKTANQEQDKSKQTDAPQKNVEHMSFRERFKPELTR